ncbi:4-dihydrotrisporin dehydrogenase [Fennellomyces sp. T-0311]|nr:4-dihydrotrisporin dehydrogenase [Fennellomyces sp. T-0311]
MTKTFVITGASRGLGAEFVRQLSAKGHIIFACARNPGSSEELKALVDGKNVHAIALDTVNEASVKAAAQKIKQLSPSGIDVLINNAGILGKRGFDTETSEASDYKEVIQTNVIGTSIVTQEFLPLLRGGDTRKIVNITSVLGSIKLTDRVPKVVVPVYRVSKAAVNMLGKLFAEELRDEGFTVLLLHPGYVQTEMGGANADITPAQSIEGMISVIENATKEDNGKCVTYDNQPLPW